MHPRKFLEKLRGLDRQFNIRHHSRKELGLGDGLFYGNLRISTIPAGFIYPYSVEDYTGIWKEVPHRSILGVGKILISRGLLQPFQLRQLLRK